MNTRLRNLLLSLTAASALAACGSGGGDDVAPPVASTTDVPLSAQSSVDGLFAYLTDLIANSTNETSEPLLVGTATLPTSETSDPR